MIKVDTKLPIDFVMRSVILSLLFGGFILQAAIFNPSFLTKESTYVPLIIIISFLILSSMFDLYLRKGYSIWYDDQTIHWRRVGLSRSNDRLISIDFAQIRDVYSISGRSVVGKMEAIGLNSGGEVANDIILSPQYIHNSDLIDLLDRIRLSSMAHFDNDVLEYMNYKP